MQSPRTRPEQQFEMLDRERKVTRADVLFDSNVLRANDDVAEKRLVALTELLLEHPDQGNVSTSTLRSTSGRRCFGMHSRRASKATSPLMGSRSATTLPQALFLRLLRR